MIWGHVPLVNVLRMMMLTLVPLQVSEAEGTSNAQTEPHSTVLSGAQASEGAVVSLTETACVHVLVLPQLSLACQVRLIIRGQIPFVTVPKTVIVTLVSAHVSKGTGGSKSQA